MADRIAVMRDGRIEQDDVPLRVYGKPATAFVARFFGQLNEHVTNVAGGRASTPFGPVSAPGFADGVRVRVLIRPEGLRLREDPNASCPAKVLAARLLGRSSWVHLCLGQAAGEGADEHSHFHARVPGRFLPAEGDVLGVELDPAQVFVFPADTPI